VLGKARVMSYEDLIVKRIEREAKEEAKTKGKRKCGRKCKTSLDVGALEIDTPEASKGKRGRKRKSPPETGVGEPMAKFVCMSKAPESVKLPVVAWMSEVQVAPVARMV
jgi:hypothetical protein